MEPSQDDDITARTKEETMVASSGKKSKSWKKKLKTKLSRKGKENKKNNLAVGENEQVVVADDNIIENSDFSGADYVNTQILGKDGGNGKRLLWTTFLKTRQLCRGVVILERVYVSDLLP